MTGYQSKKKAALDEDGMYLVHHTAQPAQEPVAWMNPCWADPDTRGWQSDSFESIPIEGWIPIYTTPPQRPWVDLTEDQLVEIGVATGLERAAVEMISNKLKEKNT
jgi:hypothetical protein